MPFRIKERIGSGLLVIEPVIFSDSRGFFMESYKESEFLTLGINDRFVQDNQSRSSKGTLRGLHFQLDPHAQAKLVRVTRGTAWDVAVDLIPDSPGYGTWYGLELSESNRLMFYIPKGFAHGFVALEDETELQYKSGAEYHLASERGIRWDDPDLAIDWPLRDVRVSEKDATQPLLKDYIPEH